MVQLTPAPQIRSNLNGRTSKIRIVAGPRSHRNVKVFIPIYPNKLPTVPKPSSAGRTASLVFKSLPASQGAITRFFFLLNRCTR